VERMINPIALVKPKNTKYNKNINNVTSQRNICFGYRIGFALAGAIFLP